jgi:predicted aldo/keto reductase-like oxidoreductase
MKKVRLGKTNLMVSEIGLGGIPLPRVPEEQAVAVVHRCLNLGINFIDTANVYTTSEERIGKALAGRRDGLVLATKTLMRTHSEIEEQLDLSLQRLGVGNIDLYQFHNVSDTETLDLIVRPGGLLTVFDKAKRDGRINHIGITCHQIDVAIQAVKMDCFETMMFPFNFITNEAIHELLPLAREHDVGFIVMKPLAGGMLKDVAIAFKYLFQFEDIVPIPGIAKIEEIDEIVHYLHHSPTLEPEEIEEMEKTKQELGTKFCRRCDYCQPCSEDIPISDVMNYKSLAKSLPRERLFISPVMLDIINKAAQCTRCGECEERCPYHLSIRDIIAENVSWYEAQKRAYEEQKV